MLLFKKGFWYINVTLLYLVDFVEDEVLVC
jgi:hypothetical protein